MKLKCNMLPQTFKSNIFYFFICKILFYMEKYSA